jgi:hypothetical protein
MLLLKPASAVPLGALVLLMVPAISHADPIRVTGGSMTASSSSELSFTGLTGEGLSIAGEGASISSGGPGAVGSIGNLDGAFDFFPISGALPQTVNGVSYTALLDGQLTLTSDRFAVEAAPGGNGSQVTFTAPFTMTGRIQGYAPAGQSGREYGMLLFDIDVIGGGLATQTKTLRDGFYSPPQAAINYTFTDAPLSATPEPASMLLMGTGLAGLFMSRRRRAE